MPTEADLHELLYISVIASAAPLGVVGKIARHARQANAQVHITGLLVFDGERFCQYLEGPADDVRRLYERIEIDPRHREVRLLHRGKSNKRQFRRFSMGFLSVDGTETLQHIESRESAAARAAFVALVPSMDMEP
ncbi:BLUF domain-containing protein [Variovorax sp. GB1R11]|uniref:BLUF domain-containing protein n=1 Tax=Variovorax sp. GB1R11 TaxID=3443741 RepID=UPI003F44C206